MEREMGERCWSSVVLASGEGGGALGEIRTGLGGEEFLSSGGWGQPLVHMFGTFPVLRHQELWVGAVVVAAVG